MGDLLYPSIPDPIATIDSLLEAVVAIKQAVELLNGQRLGNGLAKAVTPIDLAYVFGNPTLPPGTVLPPISTTGFGQAMVAARAALQQSLRDLQTIIDNSTTELQNDQETAITELQLLLGQETQHRINADEELQSQVDAIVLTNNEGAIAAIHEETVARITADDALAGQITTLSTVVDGNAAAISAEQIARSSADAALATNINTVSAVATQQRVFTQSTPPAGPPPLIVGDIWIDTAQGNLLKVWDGGAWVARPDASMAINAAAISHEVTARADADVAIGNEITTLTASVAGNTAAITNEQTVRASADTALSVQISTLSSSVGGNTAAIASEAATRATADSALSASVTSIQAQTNTNAANITAEQAARTSADTAIANSVTSLTTTVNGHTASITTIQTSLNGLYAEYSLVLNTNGHIAGFEINSGGPVSNFIVQADHFQIVSSLGGTLFTPFLVIGPDTYINRVVVNDEIVSNNYAADPSGNPTAGFRAGSDGKLRAQDARFTDFQARGGTFTERAVTLAQPNFRNGVPEGLVCVNRWASNGVILWTPTLNWGGMAVNGFHRTPDAVSGFFTQADGSSNTRTFEGTVMVPAGKRLPAVIAGDLSGTAQYVEWRDDGTVAAITVDSQGVITNTFIAQGHWMYPVEKDPQNLAKLNKLVAGLGFTRYPQPLIVPDTLSNGVTPVTSIAFKMWGAGGGRDDQGGRGGPGDYVTCTFIVGAPNSTAKIKRGDVLWLLPGEGGKSKSQEIVFGFGGRGQVQNRRSGGGGLTGVFLHSITLANMLACAGGGGGSQGGQSGGPGGAIAAGGNGVSGTDDEVMTGLPWARFSSISHAGGGGGRVGGGYLPASGSDAGGRGGTSYTDPVATSVTKTPAAASGNGNATTDQPQNTSDSDYVTWQDCLGNLADAGAGKNVDAIFEQGGNGLIVVTFA